MIFTLFTETGLLDSVGISKASDGNLWTVQGLAQHTARSYDTNGVHLNNYTISTTTFLASCEGPDGNTWAITSNGSNGVCWRITTAGVGTGVGLGSTSEASGICSGGTNLWVCGYNGSIFKVSTGVVLLNTYAITGAPVMYCITLGPDGNLWTGDATGKIQKISTGGTLLATYTTGSGFSASSIISDGTNLWMTTQGDGKIWKCTTSGTITGYLINATSLPNDVVLGPDNNLYVACGSGNVQYQVTLGGTITALTTGQPSGCFMSAVCVGADGNIWWVDYSAQNRLIRGAFPSPMQIVMIL